MNLIPILSGVGAGLVGGLLGLGGGVVLVPILSEIINLPQVKAHATSIVIIFFTGLIGTLSYLNYGTVPLVPALFTSLGALVTTPIGVLSAYRFGEKRLRRIFGLFLMIVATTMFFSVSQEPHQLLHKSLALYFLFGLATGFLSPLLGIGGGTIIVPIFVLLLGFQQHFAQGVSLFVMIPMTLMASIFNLRLNNIEFKVVPLVLLGILIGTPIGSILAHSLNSYLLGKVFGVFLFILSLRYVINPTKS